MNYNSVMTNNAVMPWLIAGHASVATISLVLGVFNLRHKPRGDRTHRTVGMVWVITMYATALSSFAIKDLDPGHYSWIHILSAFTIYSLTMGIWTGMTGRGRDHRRHMLGSYFGLVGAFIGAVAVPSRRIPVLAVSDPVALAIAAAACVLVALAVIATARRPASAGRPRPRTAPSTR